MRSSTALHITSVNSRFISLVSPPEEEIDDCALCGPVSRWRERRTHVGDGAVWQVARPKPWEVDDQLWAVIDPPLPKVERRARHPGRKRAVSSGISA